VLLAGILVVTLAPAAIMVMGEAAWWLPRWLDRVLPHMDIEGDAGPSAAPPPEPAPVAVPAQRAPDEQETTTTPSGG
jgi:RND superfamily putative drug exporter